MAGFTIDKDKAVNAALYVLERLGEADYHKVFKVLYFAEQYHLKNYGLPLTGDAYQAMQYGPVPSFIYDVFKASETGHAIYAELVNRSGHFSVHRQGKKPLVTANTSPDMDELSETDIEALNLSINENGGLNFEELVAKSHDLAWENAEKCEDIEMSYLDMAEAAGSSQEMLSYITVQAENSGLKIS